MKYAEKMNQALYGVVSIFTAEEQEAMKRGYTLAERKAISGRVYGIYPQAVSEEHAAKLNTLNFGHR